MTVPFPRCPYCGSHDVLPVEHGEDYEEDYSPEVPVYTGVTILSILLSLLVLTLIFLPLAVVAALIWGVWLWNRPKKRKRRPRGPFICLSCSSIFR